MRHRFALFLFVLSAAFALPGRSFAAPPSRGLPAGAARTATDFVKAFVKNDREAISRMLPVNLARRYGPSPFARMPVFSKPRASSRTGAIDFSGGRADTSLPDKGTMVLRKMEDNGRTVWRVRQIYWYDELPPEARQIPDKSDTSADRQQEPAIRRAAQDFLHYWMVKDYAQLDRCVFHWWEINRKPPSWVKLKSVRLREPVSSLGGIKVEFAAGLRFLGMIPKSVEGNLWLVQEDGDWRVRPLTVAFWF